MNTFGKGIVLAAVGLAMSAAGALAADKIVVASKIDTEGALLGNMIVQLLENEGYDVENKVQLGATNIVRKAITSGEVDIYPEYTGNGAFFFKMEEDPAWKNAQKAYEKVSELDLKENSLVWLQPANANNTWAIAVRGDVASENNLKTMSDFGKWVSSGGDVKLAASAEFVESAAALPAFQETYGFELSQDELLVLAGGNTAATIRAAAEQTDGTNAAMTYGTDGALAAVGLVVMEDDKGVQMVYQPAPVVRQEVLEANPKIKDILKPVFDSLDLTTLQQLNAKIAVEGIGPKQVAEDYLTSKGFLN